MNRNGDSTPSMDFDELLRRHQAFKERQSRERASASISAPTVTPPAFAVTASRATANSPSIYTFTLLLERFCGFMSVTFPIAE